MLQAAILMICLAACAGCAATVPGAAAARDASPRVELLGFASCPNTPVIYDRLGDAMRKVEPQAAVVQVDLDSLPADDARRGYPAPTVLVDGRDLFGMKPPESPSMGCRVYEGPGGAPSVEELVQRLASIGFKRGRR